MKKKIFFITILLLQFSGNIFSQIRIGSSVSNSSALLEFIVSSNKGFLLPRMSTIERDLILSPANGLLIYNTTMGEIQSNAGTSVKPKWSGSVGATGNDGLIGPAGARGPSTIITRVATGSNNTASGVNSTVGGGTGNSAVGVTATVGGGLNNQAIGGNSSVGGGANNVAVAVCTSVFGGIYNDTNGTNSSVGGGTKNSPIGNNSVVVGGSTNHVSSVSIDGCIAGGVSNNVVLVCIDCNISGGSLNVTNELNCVVSGGTQNVAGGISASVSGGVSNTSKSYGEWVGGLFATKYAPTSTIGMVVTDRAFTIGNGTAVGSRSDAMIVLKSGVALLPSATNELIASGGAKTILTKEYGNETYYQFKTIAPSTATSIGTFGEICVTPTHIYTCIATNTWVKTVVAAGSW
jgi:hypothetical protein